MYAGAQHVTTAGHAGQQHVRRGCTVQNRPTVQVKVSRAALHTKMAQHHTWQEGAHQCVCVGDGVVSQVEVFDRQVCAKFCCAASLSGLCGPSARLTINMLTRGASLLHAGSGRAILRLSLLQHL